MMRAVAAIGAGLVDLGHVWRTRGSFRVSFVRRLVSFYLMVPTQLEFPTGRTWRRGHLGAGAETAFTSVVSTLVVVLAGWPSPSTVSCLRAAERVEGEGAGDGPCGSTEHFLPCVY